ncbi:MAG: prepilin-type N-terminal cleavage/methylation domain-containing protein [Limnohabitans sp.]|nr:prepilin-type N-terminal cleavage/methylation domain-containing protein [Limnohabitans sp.]
MTFRRHPNTPGFTLIEVLVALSLLALLAGMGWQGISGLLRAREHTQTRIDAVARVQTTLAQWHADLDALQIVPTLDPAGVRWDGRVLRWVRRSVQAGQVGMEGGLQVVAWRLEDGVWHRWLSAPVRTPGELQQAWQSAVLPAPGLPVGGGDWAVQPLRSWRLVYFRGNAWTNPLSSADSAAIVSSSPGAKVSSPSPTGQTSSSNVAAAPAGQVNTPPDAIRLVIEFGPSAPFAGPLTVDWLRPDWSVARP